eukprot:TRINITY_DN5938_c0_g1_i1.p1 TRINITY_DN5938_c0_g1~~TRINITY_DN5938_c0_g1_i1.p1  ORF type:complete len:191 (-),score=34.48 TRINITY_DN5938_c0_g1_i1:177-749(-)
MDQIKNFLDNGGSTRSMSPPLPATSSPSVFNRLSTLTSSATFEAQQQTDESSFTLDVCSGMSYTKKLTGFVTCLLLGIMFCFLSTTFLLAPRQFAKFYTLGCLCLIGSGTFLVGPSQQLKTMCDPSRVLSAIIFLLSMIGTLYCAMVIRRSGATMGMMLVQLCAAGWYGASYVPFAQSCIQSTVRGVIAV